MKICEENYEDNYEDTCQDVEQMLWEAFSYTDEEGCDCYNINPRLAEELLQTPYTYDAKGVFHLTLSHGVPSVLTGDLKMLKDFILHCPYVCKLEILMLVDGTGAEGTSVNIPCRGTDYMRLEQNK